MEMMKIEVITFHNNNTSVAAPGSPCASAAQNNSGFKGKRLSRAPLPPPADYLTTQTVSKS